MCHLILTTTLLARNYYSCSIKNRGFQSCLSSHISYIAVIHCSSDPCSFPLITVVCKHGHSAIRTKKKSHHSYTKALNRKSGIGLSSTLQSADPYNSDFCFPLYNSKNQGVERRRLRREKNKGSKS